MPSPRLLQVAFDLQGGELVRHHADAPALFVGLGVAIAVGEDLVGRLVLVALAERTEAAPVAKGSILRRHRPLGAVGGDDDPAAHNRILAQFRHWQPFSEGIRDRLGDVSEATASFGASGLIRLIALLPQSAYTSHMICSKSGDAAASS